MVDRKLRATSAAYNIATPPLKQMSKRLRFRGPHDGDHEPQDQDDYNIAGGDPSIDFDKHDDDLDSPHAKSSHSAGGDSSEIKKEMNTSAGGDPSKITKEVRTGKIVQGTVIERQMNGSVSPIHERLR